MKYIWFRNACIKSFFSIGWFFCLQIRTILCMFKLGFGYGHLHSNFWIVSNSIRQDLALLEFVWTFLKCQYRTLLYSGMAIFGCTVSRALMADCTVVGNHIGCTMTWPCGLYSGMAIFGCTVSRALNADCTMVLSQRLLTWSEVWSLQLGLKSGSCPQL